MRITNTNARLERDGRHNDRNFDLDLAPHIDQIRVKNNKYWSIDGSESLRSFKDIELDFYEDHFSEHVEAQNARNRERRQYKRNKKMEQYYRAPRTQPEDKILQIGDCFDSVSGETLWACAMSYIERFNAAFGSHCKIVDAALHMDEATPHVHIRRVWMADDKDGNKYVSESKALEQLGFDKDDKSKAQSKYNNAVVSFTKTDKAMFECVCQEQGIQFEKESRDRKKGVSAKIFKEIVKEVEETFRDRLKFLEDKVEEMKNIISEYKSIIADMTEFLKTQQMWEEFQRFRERKKKEREANKDINR